MHPHGDARARMALIHLGLCLLVCVLNPPCITMHSKLDGARCLDTRASGSVHSTTLIPAVGPGFRDTRSHLAGAA